MSEYEVFVVVVMVTVAVYLVSVTLVLSVEGLRRVDLKKRPGDGEVLRNGGGVVSGGTGVGVGVGLGLIRGRIESGGGVEHPADARITAHHPSVM